MGIGSIARIASKGWNYAGRLIFDDRFATKITSSLKNSGNYYKRCGKGRFYQFDKQIGRAFQKADKYTSNKKNFQSLKDSLKSYKTDVSALWKSDKKLFSKIGGTLKGLGKRAPLIGTALMVAFELPNIFKATKEGGLVNGAAETGKSAVRIAAGVACGAIGTAILGPLGSIPGFIIGDLLGKLVVGKSYSEKKAAQEQKITEMTGMNGIPGQQTTPYQTIPQMQMTMSPQELMALQQMLYSNTQPQPQLNVTA